MKLVMQDNVDLALQNCVKLESIEKAAGKLRQHDDHRNIGYLDCSTLKDIGSVLVTLVFILPFLIIIIATAALVHRGLAAAGWRVQEERS